MIANPAMDTVARQRTKEGVRDCRPHRRASRTAIAALPPRRAVHSYHAGRRTRTTPVESRVARGSVNY